MGIRVPFLFNDCEVDLIHNLQGDIAVHDNDLQALSEGLFNARVKAQPIEQLSEKYKFSEADAYSIQEMGIELREKNGEKVIGLKMGLTSEAKRKQMDLHSPLYGVLTDKMQVQNNGTFNMTGSIHPKIEPEVAFFIAKDLEGNVSREEVLEACDGFCAALEILDSRYKQFKYFSLEDVISDNSSSSHFILGPKVSIDRNIDLKNLSMQMLVNDQVAQEGKSDAISGDPVVSIIQQVELLAKRGKKLEAGTFVLAGAATAAVALEPGMKVSLKVDHLEDVNVNIEA